MSIKQIFDEIAAESSTNQKMVILGKYKDNETLKRVLYLANSKRIKFYIKQIPTYLKAGNSIIRLEDALDSLQPIIDRKITGNDAIVHLQELLSSLHSDDVYIIERIIERDCKIGMGTHNINKVIPQLTEVTPYMGAKAYSDKLVSKLFEGGKQVISQKKMDGRYSNCIIRSGEVDLESRQGESTLLDGALFINDLRKFDDCVLNGELVMGNGIDRYESNGIIASLVSIGKKIRDGEDVSKEITKFESKHMNYQLALDSIKFVVWDTITVDEYFDTKSSTPYNTRLSNVINMMLKYEPIMVSIIDSRLVKSVDEAMAHFKEMLMNNEEGTILKSYDGIWKDGKPNHQIKVKKEINLDLKIVGFNYGTGKNKNLISSVNVESSDGLLKTSPTGINEDKMEYITNNQDKLLNTIVEIKCSGLSQDSEGNYSVLHPVYKIERTDKDTANTLEECIEIDNATKFV